MALRTVVAALLTWRSESWAGRELALWPSSGLKRILLRLGQSTCPGAADTGILKPQLGSSDAHHPCLCGSLFLQKELS